MSAENRKNQQEVRISKFMAKVLRHKPELIGLQVDKNGWADVEELLTKAEKPGFDRDMLERIVALDEKGRYEFDAEGRRIRACQGHSIQVDAGWIHQPAPAVLYHGSAVQSEEAIDREGLKPMSRLLVHLSKDAATARSVGSRHGRPVIYAVDARKMEEDGYSFYQAHNGVWLTEAVPPRYLKKLPLKNESGGSSGS